LNESALEFLSTPNPSLRVRDFIDRSGLDFEQYSYLLEAVGFDDPNEVLTNEMGGRFLKDESLGKIRNLFNLLRQPLEALFENERKGVTIELARIGYKSKKSAIVDVGWNASSLRSLAALNPKDDPLVGYYFGTWKEAEVQEDDSLKLNSFFMHLGKPLEHAALVRESVNLIEIINTAPCPTLLSFEIDGDEAKPIFSNLKDAGLSVSKHKKLWSGSRDFLEDYFKVSMPASFYRSSENGFIYLSQVLDRLLRRPTEAEIEEWGDIRHSEGFGLEVSRPLVASIGENVFGVELLDAFEASNWKRAFLAKLSQDQRQFVLDRSSFQTPPPTYTEMKESLRWKTLQADEYWKEKESLKLQLKQKDAQLDETIRLKESYVEKLTFLQSTLTEFKEDSQSNNHSYSSMLSSLNTGMDSQFEDLVRLLGELKVDQNKLEALRRNLESLQAELKDRDDQLRLMKIELAEASAKLDDLSQLLSSKLSVFKQLFKSDF